MDNKYEFSEWLNKQFNSYELTEAKLAHLVNVSQKSINRYRNAITCPNETVQKRIKDFFAGVESNKLNLKNIPPEFFGGEPDECYAPIDDDPAAYGIYNGKEQLRYYTETAQKFILEHCYTYYFMEPYEFVFMDKVLALSENAREQLVEKMESIPIRMQMLFGSDWENYQLNDTLNQMEGYAGIIHWPLLYPENWHTKIDPETNLPKTQYRKKNDSKFDDFCETLFYQGYYMNSKHFYKNVERCIDYNLDDWYILFLLARTRMADEADQSCKKIYLEVEEHGLKEREYMIWQYLDVLAYK